MFQTVLNPWSILASVCRPAIRVGALLVMVALLGASTASAQVVVFAPHPDDEALFASGIIYQAKQAGKTVKVVVATNGDCEDAAIGQTRERETLAGMALLGVPATDVIFLGYPDCGLREMYYYYTTATSQFTSVAGFTKTYAYEGFGGVDYHRMIYGISASYSGYSVIQDVQTVLRNYKPQDIYVTSAYDANFDHYALNFMVLEATLAQMQADATFQPTIHDALVHEPCELCDPSYHWPLPSGTPATPFPMPASLPPTPLSWTAAERVIVPAIMQLLSPTTNLKSRAISQYVSQDGTGAWAQSFVRSDEVFWKNDLWANRAIQATATASSSLNTGNTVDHINDGAVVGTPVVPVNRGRKGEWISSNQVAGAWAQLTWATSRAVTSVVLHDRTDPAENITAGNLTFSDGSSIAVGVLPSTGVGLTVQFAQKNVSWVRFTVTSGQGSAAGLSEFEVYGPATSKLPWQAPGANTQPAIVGGPTAAPATITDIDTSTVTVTGFDNDGDALTYSWSSSGGRIDGIGSTVSFVPPTVTAQTTFQITVFVADGRGGLLSSSIPIVVTHSTGSHNVAPTATATASSFSAAHGQTANKAIDGIVSGYPTDSLREWATEGQLAGAWIQLTWSTPQTISRSVLHDRINTTDHILAGTLRFSDGSTVAVGALPNDGTGLITDFVARTVTWIRFEITSAQGGSTGLAEWEVFSATSTGPPNVSPQISSGPTATPSAINDIQTSSLSVVASDADGDTLTYTWTTSAGTIVGTSSTVSFTPPHVTAPTTVRVDVLVLDGRGGSATRFVNISVTPSSTSINLASFATATASTANDGRGQGADKAIDGVVSGYPTDSSREWAAVGQLAGAWIQLTWQTPQMLAQVVLHDRINTSDQILAGTLRFSDGSTVSVGALLDNGAAVTVNFAQRSVSWVRLEINGARGDNTGLAEFEVYAPSGGPANTPPQITAGPTATPATITDIQTTNLTVTASDADGDPLSFVWQTTGGSIIAGPTVTFTPPRVTVPTTFRVTVSVNDGRGGSDTDYIDILVTPSNTLLNLAPLATVTASSENSGRSQDAAKAVDGVVSGYPVDPTTEWASVGQLAGAWIRLTWTSARTVSQVVLHDRINTEDQILAGTLTFSDGSSVPVSVLSNDGTGLQLTFAARNVTWVQLNITSARGSNTGLAEIKVY